MKNLLVLLLIASCLTACKQSSSTDNDAKMLSSTTTIVFGSCTREGADNQLWSEIANENPHLFIFLGDNIYGDTHDMQLMQQKYDQQKSDPDYQNLLNQTQIIGTWDDHDYGINDGGKYYSKKDSSKLLMLDFLDVHADAAVRKHPGVYSRYTLEESGKTIKVILLDTRYFRDTLIANPTGETRYLPNNEGDLLGEAQWTWLEKELKSSNADINIIGSSIQVLSDKHAYEKWANFPAERQRLLDLIKQTQPKNTIIISGDRHIAELSAIEIDGQGHQLFDFTASGLTHTWSTIDEEENPYRIGELIIKENYGVITFNWDTKEVTFKVAGGNNQTYFTHTHQLEVL